MSQTPGWYHAEGDPADTMRYWDGTRWIGEPTTQTPTYSGDGIQYGDAGERLLAQIIDGLIVGGIGIILALVFGVAEDAFTGAPSLGFLLINLLVAIAYDIGLIATRGATVGKQVMSLKVVTTDHESPPGWVPAALRWIPTLFGIVPILGFFLGIGQAIASGVMISNDDQNRSVGDRIGSTFVVKS